jgi:hypothetical protein
MTRPLNINVKVLWGQFATFTAFSTTRCGICSATTSTPRFEVPMPMARIRCCAMWRRVVLSKFAMISEEFAASVLMVQQTFYLLWKRKQQVYLETLRNFYPATRRQSEKAVFSSVVKTAQWCPVVVALIFVYFLLQLGWSSSREPNTSCDPQI